MSKILEIIIKATGADAARAAFAGVGSAATGMGSDVKAAGQDAAGGLDDAASKADALRGGLESLRNGAAVVAGIGVAAIALASNFADAFIEADRLGGKMESLLAARGLSAASDQIKGLASDLSALTGVDDDQLAASLAGAIASGRVQGLKEYGIVIDATGKAAIKAASDISAQAGAQETLNQVMTQGAAAVDSMRANLSDATIKTGEFQRDFGNLEEKIGESSAAARAHILGGIVSSLDAVLERNPGLRDSAGAILYIGGSALAAVGGLVSFGAQVGLSAIALKGMGISGAASFALIRTAAAATIPFLTGVATALAIPLAVLTAGLLAGVAIYEGLRALKVPGFANAASTKDILASVRNDVFGSAGAAPPGPASSGGDALKIAELESKNAALTAAALPVPGLTSGALMPGVAAGLAPRAVVQRSASPQNAAAQNIALALMGGGQIGGGVGGGGMVPVGAGDNIARGDGRGNFTARVGDMKQGPDGGFLVQFEPIKIPNQGAAQSRGRY